MLVFVPEPALNGWKFISSEGAMDFGIDVNLVIMAIVRAHHQSHRAHLMQKRYGKDLQEVIDAVTPQSVSTMTLPNSDFLALKSQTVQDSRATEVTFCSPHFSIAARDDMFALTTRDDWSCVGDSVGSVIRSICYCFRFEPILIDYVQRER